MCSAKHDIVAVAAAPPKWEDTRFVTPVSCIPTVIEVDESVAVVDRDRDVPQDIAAHPLAT
jgi:hypothetical protein